MTQRSGHTLTSKRMHTTSEQYTDHTVVISTVVIYICTYIHTDIHLSLITTLIQLAYTVEPVQDGHCVRQPPL